METWRGGDLERMRLRQRLRPCRRGYRLRMTWEELADELDFEARQLQQPCPALDGLRHHTLAQASLALEALHRLALARAVQHRCQSGYWPDWLCAELKFLLRLRIHHVAQHVSWLTALGGAEGLTVEQVLAVFADREWPRFRYEAHLELADANAASVDNPFADRPDGWSQ